MNWMAADHLDGPAGLASTASLSSAWNRARFPAARLTADLYQERCRVRLSLAAVCHR